MTDAYAAAFPSLTFERPDAGILRIVLDGPGLNAVGPAGGHRASLAEVWLTVDRDPTCGRGARGCRQGVLGRRRLRPHRHDRQRLHATAPVSSAKHGPRVQHHQLLEADRLGDAGPAVGAGLVAGCWPTFRSWRATRGSSTATAPRGRSGDHATICWPLLCGMAKAKYYLLTCESMTGEEAERIGLVSLCVDATEVQENALDIARKLAGGAQSAIRSTKHALNHWYRMMGPTFGTLLAYEFYGFGGPDATEGLAAHVEKRPPTFEGPTSE